MQLIYTFDVSKIKIQIIDSLQHYEAFIPINDINKKLIILTVFIFII